MRSARVGDQAWFVDHGKVFSAVVIKLHPHHGWAGVADSSEARGIAWFCEENVFWTEVDARAQCDAWVKESATGSAP